MERPDFACHHPEMNIPWEDLQLFLAIAEEKSLTGAARTLNLGQPTVSRRLADLEHRLGARLFRRSVEGAVPTEAGERLLSPARKMAEWAGEVGRAVEERDGAPTGLVRVTAPPFVSFDFLAPFAAFLATRHVGLRLEVSSAMEFLDLSRGQAEVALRTRPSTQADLIQLLEIEHENAVFVSKALAARLPRKPALADIPWVAWAPPFEHFPPNPQLQELSPRVVPSFTSDSFLVQVAAVESGLGAMVLPKKRHRFSRLRDLVPLDVELGPFARSSIYLVAPKSALEIPRVRTVADLLVAELQT
jgi:DNA-binding transcriptional LysR family regulator